MPIGLTTALLAGAGLSAAGKVAGGISAARTARGMFSDEDARRLDELKRRRAQGDLGLTEGQRGMAEAAPKFSVEPFFATFRRCPSRRHQATVKPSWAPWARRTR
jgi:hypothetical protein